MCVGDTSQVGVTQRALAHMAMDMAGNVWEWVNDCGSLTITAFATQQPAWPRQ
jgi:formylglycine-generating enzyme required for sulfatase activity